MFGRTWGCPGSTAGRRGRSRTGVEKEEPSSEYRQTQMGPGIRDGNQFEGVWDLPELRVVPDWDDMCTRTHR